MAFSQLILKNPIPCLAVTLTVILCNAFSGYGFLSTLITIFFVFISSIVFNFSKQKSVFVKAPPEEEDKQISPTIEMEPFSENESIGNSSITDHDSEIDCPCAINQDCSDDGSISDEESLIEIALPSGHFVSTEKASVFKDFSADMNCEEDNLIEIDLSIGSIKCSRFEMKA